MVVQNVCAACISLDRPIIFLATHDPVTNAPQIRVVQPETWDMEAKRLILAGCLSDASALVDDQFTQLIDLCNQRPATSGFAKKIFSAVCFISKVGFSSLFCSARKEYAH